MKNKGILISYDDVVEIIHNLGGTFDLTPPMGEGYSIQLDIIADNIRHCKDACQYVVSTIEHPKVSTKRNAPFMCSAKLNTKGGMFVADWNEVSRAVHSFAFATSVLLLANINPQLFIEYITYLPTCDSEEDARCQAVVAVIKSYAEEHGIPLNGRNNCNASCEVCL